MKLPVFLDWKRPAIGVLAVGFCLPLAMAQQSAPQNPNQTEQPAVDEAETETPMEESKPPEDAPPVMRLTKELITADEVETLRKEVLKERHTILFSNARLDEKSKQVIAKWAKWRIYAMTLESNRRKLHELRNDLMRDISYAGRSRSVAPKDKLAFRYVMCEEVTKRAAELLDNNFYVRLNAAIILGQLNLTEDVVSTLEVVEEQAYVGAAIPLLEVIKAPTGGGVDEQLEAVKIQAAIGLGRINLLGPPGDLNRNVENQNFRNLMAKTLIAQLQDKKSHDWYQKRLIDALGSIDLVNDISTGRPIIVQALGEVLADRDRHFCVRSRAARSLGRCPLPPGLNIQKLVHQILRLENEMALAYQKSPNEYYWLDCFQDVYFAFHPVADSEVAMYGSRRVPGLNQKNLGPLVQEAYQQHVVPIVAHVITQPGWTPPKDGEEWAKNAPIPNQLISGLGKWLQDHLPADHRLAPALPELDPQSPADTGTTTGGS